MKLISVIMPVYNGEKYLKEAIDSVLNQTLRDFEFIIINDGSTDNSKSIIETYDDKRIIHIEQENKGLSKTLNIGVSYCNGEFIARMDQDDISVSSRFLNQYLFFNSHPNISVLSGAFSYIDKNGKYLGRSFSITNPFLIKKKLLNSGCVVCHPAVMMRRKDFLDVGGYSEIIGGRFTDYHLWVKFITNGFKIQNMSKILLKYRIIESSMSSEFSLSNTGIKVLLKVIKEENPTSRDLSNLNNACIVNANSFSKRENTFNNTENYLYHRATFINENIKNYIFSAVKNIGAFIH
jgi:glycosyltransferase involved in cell wall biosynthesis